VKKERNDIIKEKEMAQNLKNEQKEEVSKVRRILEEFHSQ
jgi:hypothetical protein